MMREQDASEEVDAMCEGWGMEDFELGEPVRHSEASRGGFGSRESASTGIGRVTIMSQHIDSLLQRWLWKAQSESWWLFLFDLVAG